MKNPAYPWSRVMKQKRLFLSLFLVLFLACTANAGKITTQFAKVKVYNMYVGCTYRLNEDLDGPLFDVTYEGGTVDIQIQPTKAVVIGSVEQSEGFEVIPSTAWITPVTELFEDVLSGVKKETDLKICIPADLKYREKKYAVGIEASTTQDYAPGVLGKFFFTISKDLPQVSSFITADGGTVSLNDGNPDDGETQVIIPEGALTTATTITIEQLDPDSVASAPEIALADTPVVAFKFLPSDLKFNLPVTIVLRYLDIDNDGIIDGTEIDENSIKMFYYDGFEWLCLGGTVDAEKNIVTAKVTHFSYFALFPTRAFAASDYRPAERIITPAYADHDNDEASFRGLAGTDTTIKIFDITGRKVKVINEAPYEWAGDDENGNIVESGVYIYQFRVEVDGEEKLVSGVIAVAK